MTISREKFGEQFLDFKSDPTITQVSFGLKIDDADESGDQTGKWRNNRLFINAVDADESGDQTGKWRNNWLFINAVDAINANKKGKWRNNRLFINAVDADESGDLTGKWRNNWLFLMLLTPMKVEIKQVNDATTDFLLMLLTSKKQIK